MGLLDRMKKSGHEHEQEHEHTFTQTYAQIFTQTHSHKHSHKHSHSHTPQYLRWNPARGSTATTTSQWWQTGGPRRMPKAKAAGPPGRPPAGCLAGLRIRIRLLGKKTRATRQATSKRRLPGPRRPRCHPGCRNRKHITVLGEVSGGGWRAHACDGLHACMIVFFWFFCFLFFSLTFRSFTRFLFVFFFFE